jgi:aspartyl aminopeptidase
VAFTVGAKFKPGNGFKIVGGHTGTFEFMDFSHERCRHWLLCRRLINVCNVGFFGSTRKSMNLFGAAHTDSPHLKVKPMSKRAGSGCVQLGVECYGGG